MDDPAPVVTDAPAAETTASFEVFFETWRHRLNGALTLMTANAQEAEELTQDAFIEVWSRWDRVREMERPDGYLYRVAMNGFRKRWRRMRLDLRLRARAEDERDPFEEVAAKDEVARALALLPRRERAALVLTEMLELDSNEAGELLRIKPSTVRVLTHRARQRVRTALERDDD